MPIARRCVGLSVLWISFAFLLVCGGCDASQRPPGVQDVDGAGATRAGAALPDTLRPPAPDGSPPAGATADASLALDGDGLRIFLASGAARPIPFGTPAAAAKQAIRAALGSPPLDEGTSFECPGEYVNWRDGLTTWFAEDHFIGWSLRADEGRFTTVTGIGIGSTRAQLESSHVLQVYDSSLGVEFTFAGMAGILESPEPDARVLHLWAGQTCIAR